METTTVSPNIATFALFNNGGQHLHTPTDVMQEICLNGYGKVRIPQPGLYDRMKVAMKSKLSDESAYKVSENMTTPWGGCYHLGEEESAAIADPRGGCYIWDDVSDVDSPLFNHTVVDFDANLVDEWRDMLVNVTTSITGDICETLGQPRTCANEQINPRPYMQTLLSRYMALNQSVVDKGFLEIKDPSNATITLNTEYGIGAHRDYGYFAFIAQMEEGGLQVQSRSGSWVDVPQEDDTLTFVAGESLEVLTGGICRAAPHRVLAPSRTRYSVTTFVDPSLTATISPSGICGDDGCSELLKVLAGGEGQSTDVNVAASAMDMGNSFCWGDYLLFLYCRMFLKKQHDFCETVVKGEYPAPYEVLEYGGRTNCSHDNNYLSSLEM